MFGRKRFIFFVSYALLLLFTLVSCGSSDYKARNEKDTSEMVDTGDVIKESSVGVQSDMQTESNIVETDQAVLETEPVEFEEGTDTVCEVIGYSDYTGVFDHFLKEGDSVAVITPSSLPTREQTDAVINGLKEWGYVPVEGKYVCVPERTLENILEDFKWALSDPDIKAIFCVRGGYGSTDVIDNIPLDLVTSSDKPIIGFSDITSFHSAWTVAGVPSIHASMSAAFSDFPAECAAAEENILKGMIPSYKCSGSKYDQEGMAEGILIGGNLATFTAVLNTAYDCSVTDEPYIIFLEDIGENMEHLHRYLTVLKNFGVFDRASGIIFGEWTGLPADYKNGFGKNRGGNFTSVADMISREILQGMDIPVAFDFPAGHGEANYPMLMGRKVSLDVSEDSFTLKWSEGTESTLE